MKRKVKNTDIIKLSYENIFNEDLIKICEDSINFISSKLLNLTSTLSNNLAYFLRNKLIELTKQSHIDVLCSKNYKRSNSIIEYLCIRLNISKLDKELDIENFEEITDIFNILIKLNDSELFDNYFECLKSEEYMIKSLLNKDFIIIDKFSNYFLQIILQDIESNEYFNIQSEICFKDQDQLIRLQKIIEINNSITE